MNEVTPDDIEAAEKKLEKRKKKNKRVSQKRPGRVKGKKYPKSWSAKLKKENEQILIMRCAGKTMEEIEAATGVAKSTITLRLRENDSMRRLLNSFQERMVQISPEVANEFEALLLHSDDSTKLGAIKEYLKLLRLAPVANPDGGSSTVINGLYIQNNTVISPETLDILKRYSQERPQAFEITYGLKNPEHGA